MKPKQETLSASLCVLGNPVPLPLLQLPTLRNVVTC